MAGIRSRRLAPQRIRSFRVFGVKVLDPVATLFTCADELSLDDVVVMLDSLITSADNYPGDMTPVRPLATLADVRERLAVWGKFPGSGKIRKALPLAREHVESPKETETRLMICHARMPEPAVQHEVWDHGRFVARVDLAYPELKIAIEYEGDGHRRSRKQWREDIRRQRELEDLGWIVIRLTESDLSDPDSVIARVRHARARSQAV